MRSERTFLDNPPQGDDDHRVENERQMGINRMVITTILFGAVSIFGRDHASFGSGFMAGAYLAYLALAALFFAHVSIWPRARAWRRVAVLFSDILALSYVAYHAGPAYVGLLYPGYLLIIYGFGFRYGVKWIAASGIMSVVAVAVTVRLSPLWRGDDLLAGGLIVGLIIIPAYALNLVRNLWQAKAKAEESARAKSMFVAAVSHDLRTPLNAIIGLGDILAASKLPREEADMARMIGQAGRSLLGQIDSILDFSRLEMGRQPAECARVDLFDMLHSIRELLDVSAQAKGLRLLLRIDAPTPRWIMSNARHIRDSLVNLVGNAIKFTPSGHVEIAVRATTLGGGRARMRFEVRDSGIGLGADEQARIFDRFTQANEGIRETYGGSGLGLAIARQLVLGLDGELGVSSVKGSGSTFWFEFDAEVAGPEEARQDIHRTADYVGKDAGFLEVARAVGLSLSVRTDFDDCDGERATRQQRVVVVDARARQSDVSPAGRRAQIEAVGRRPAIFLVDDEATLDLRSRAAGSSVVLTWPRDARILSDAFFAVAGVATVDLPHIEQARAPARDLAILVAEDNKTNQKVIGKMLSLVGRKATIVDDGHAALDVLAHERFDVVLMDINMPRVDGIEATRRLRMFERSLGRRTPVIALTADVTDETRARCMAAGIDDCITKPIDLPKLLAAIDRLLDIDMAVAPPPIEAPMDDEAAEKDEDASAGQASDEDINAGALADLERLGGADFVREVASQFVADAALILRELAAAATEGDIEKFRDEAHALRSCSANVGARSIYRLCLSWRQIGPEEFAAEGLAHVRRLEREYEKARAGLAPYIAEAA
ncbi:MAG TPA: response regulator [Rhodoblastus sp.]|nr:response regulator [Rhodoblastus sp.]